VRRWRPLPVWARSLVLAACALLTGLAAAACGDEAGSEASYDWGLPEGLPAPSVPSDNPMSAEKVELGRYLFYDVRLSANETQACGTCHRQELAFTDGAAVATGSTGESHRRNTMSLTNVAYNSTFTWAHPGLLEVEDQILIPMFGETPIELGIAGHEEEVLDRLRGDPLYRELFGAAFPQAEDPISFDHIVDALASFVRTLLSHDSPFDRRVYDDDLTALSPSAQRGLDLFFSERLECFHCHGGFNFTQSTVHESSSQLERPFHNTGLYNVDGDGAYPARDTGLYELTGVAHDMGRFRAPTLRNIELTAPYMHDGSLETLEDVVRFYENGGRVIAEGPDAGNGQQSPLKSSFVSGFELTDHDRDDVIAFLRSLTDQTFVTNPAFSSPFE